MNDHPTPVSLTDAEWRERLTPSQFAVCRLHATEHPFTGPWRDHHQTGTYVCIACHQALFGSDEKFESHSGWPSWFAPLPGALSEKDDHSLGVSRVEISCSHCGAHLGHVFDDGPAPTGLRYCVNGTALDFVAEGQPLPALLGSAEAVTPPPPAKPLGEQRKTEKGMGFMDRFHQWLGRHGDG